MRNLPDFSWRRIKHDFLRHFHLPRCDLLVWILVTKLAPTYYRKLDQLLTETGRYRELSSWRKGFKKQWRKLEKTPITLPLNDAYKPDVKRWVCTCPAFVVSRFLICKHLVQSMHHVPPVFFLEVKRYRNTPFWRHGALKPQDESSGEETETSAASGRGADEYNDDVEDDGGENDDDSEEEDGDNAFETHHNGHTFEETIGDEIDLILNFAKGLQHQVQYRDQRMLNTLQREGASFLRLARACMEKERRTNSTRSSTVATWEKSTSSAMFYRARPTVVDQRT